MGLTIRQQVDQILAARKRLQDEGVQQVAVELEPIRQRKVQEAKENFPTAVLEAAKRGNPYAKILELDDEGAPAGYSPDNDRGDLRSDAYKNLWDFLENEGFTPAITSFSNEDGVGYGGIGYSSDSYWIICYLEARN